MAFRGLDFDEIRLSILSGVSTVAPFPPDTATICRIFPHFGNPTRGQERSILVVGGGSPLLVSPNGRVFVEIRLSILFGLFTPFLSALRPISVKDLRGIAESWILRML